MLKGCVRTVITKVEEKNLLINVLINSEPTMHMEFVKIAIFQHIIENEEQRRGRIRSC